MRPTQFADEEMGTMKASKSDVNWMVMDYLVSEGYPEAAEKFAQETNIALPSAPEDIRERVLIRNAIHAGKLDEAIEMITAIDTQILESNHPLHFSLLQLQLIELIRDILAHPDNANPARAFAFEPAIKFAQEHLAPRAPTGKVYQDALEKTMGLMLFPADKMPADIKALLDTSLRAKIAAEVNMAILASKGERREAKLRQLVHARLWTDKEAREAKFAAPSLASLGFDSPQVVEAMRLADAMVL